MLHRLKPQEIRYGAGILFTDGKRVLLLQRAEKEDEGKWSIPGGRADPGESALETAKRETKEEVGEVHGKQFAKFVYKDDEQHFTTYLFAIDKDEKFDPELSKEHSRAKWIKIKSLKDYDLHPKFKEELSKYIKAIESHFNKEIKGFKEWLEIYE